MVQEVAQEIVTWQEENEQDEEEYESNEDVDSEGHLILDFDDDSEYSESEALQILAYHTGQAQVRRDLLQDKTNLGFRPRPRPEAATETETAGKRLSLSEKTPERVAGSYEVLPMPNTGTHQP